VTGRPSRDIAAQADELEAFLTAVLERDDRRRAGLDPDNPAGPTEILLRERERHLKIVR